MKTPLQNKAHGHEGLQARPLNKALGGKSASAAREFYRNLEKHYLQNDCRGCSSFTQYSVLLIKGQAYHHLELFSPDQNIPELLSQLKKAGMIKEERDGNLYRITFLKLAEKEVTF